MYQTAGSRVMKGGNRHNDTGGIMGNPYNPELRLRIWQRGAFTATLASPAEDRYVLVAGDGKGSVRTATVQDGIWSETATSTATRWDGLAVRNVRVAVDKAGTVSRTDVTTFPSGASTRVETIADGLQTTRRSIAGLRGGGSLEEYYDGAGTVLRLGAGDGTFRTGRVELMGVPGLAQAESAVTVFDDGSRQVVTPTDNGRITEKYDTDGVLTERRTWEQVEVDGGTAGHTRSETFDHNGVRTGWQESLVNVYDDNSWNGTVWGQNPDGSTNHSVHEGHGDTSARTAERTRADGVVERESSTSSTSHGTTITVAERTQDGKLVERSSTETDSAGHERSSTTTRFHEDGGASITYRYQDGEGHIKEDHKTVDREGNPVPKPENGDDSTELPPDDGGWDEPWDEFHQPWRVLADEIMGDALAELGAYTDDIAGRVAGKVALDTRIDQVRGALTTLVTDGAGWNDALAEEAGAPILDLRLDTATAATVNTGLADLTDSRSVLAFVADLTAAAGGLASAELLLPTG